MSLWDDTTSTVHVHISSKDPMNSVILVTTDNPKLFGGNMFLNSTPATRFFFNPTIQTIKEFTKKLWLKILFTNLFNVLYAYSLKTHFIYT